MYIDLIVYPLLLCLGLMVFTKDCPEDRKRLIIWSSIILLLKTSLRSVSIGSDTCHYAQYFIEMHNRSWTEIWTLFSERYFVLGLLGGDDDMGYKLISKFVSVFTDSFGVFTFVMQGVFFFLPIGLLIYKLCTDSKQTLFAYVLLNALFMGLPMANCRQVYAIGLSVASFMLIQEKKYLKSAMCLLIGITMHKSCLLSIIPFALSFVNYKWFRIAVISSFFIVPITFLNTGAIITAMGNFISSDKYAEYGHEVARGGANIYILFSILMALFCAYSLWERYTTGDTQLKLLFAMIPLTVALCPLINNNGSMIRITMYFQIFFVALMPIAIREYSKGTDKYFLLIMILLIFMSLNSANKYVFFWQEDQNPLLYWDRTFR